MKMIAVVLMLFTVLSAATSVCAENIEVQITIIVPDGAVSEFREWLDAVFPSGSGADYDLRLAQYARPQIISQLQGEFKAYYMELIRQRVEAQMTNAVATAFE